MSRPVRITGVASLRRVLRVAPAQLREEMVDAVATSLEELQAGMLARVPRDSGDLASVIKIKLSRDRMSGRVGPGAAGKRDERKAGWRAKYVEFGTLHMAAQPFVYVTAREKWGQIRQRLAGGVAAALAKIARPG